MSDSPWYYSDANSQQQGPYSAHQIQQLATSGTINPQTLLWQEGMEEWKPAGEIQGIFPNPAPAPAPVVSTNPYTSPRQTPFGAAPTGGEFPIPPVKKSSFGLFLGAYLAGIALIAIAIIFLISAGKSVAKDNSYQDNDFSHIEEAGAAGEPEVDEDPRQPTTPSTPEFKVSDEDAAKGIVFLFLLLLGGLCMTFGGIYAYVILYRAWYAIQPGGAQTTPGKAVGFLFIPIFGIYWMFIAFKGWANDWTRIRTSYSNLMASPAASPGTFLSGCILMLLFPPVGVFFFFAMISQMCAVTNYMASTYSLSQTQSTGLTGTKFY